MFPNSTVGSLNSATAREQHASHGVNFANTHTPQYLTYSVSTVSHYSILQLSHGISVLSLLSEMTPGLNSTAMIEV